MKPSKIFGSEEECQSSESGWTMYIGSHIEDDDGDIYSGEYEETTHEAYPEDDESDDSMVSDASSGPSHQHGNNIDKGVNYGLTSFKQVVVEVEENQYDDENKYCLEKKANKTVEKQKEEKKVENKEMKFVDGNSKGKSSVQGGGKVRKRK
ncbi:protein SOB FIVE-LIKE [Trifolium repens]|nr:protein SOB FIVE-LIKE [Trifolium repens]